MNNGRPDPPKIIHFVNWPYRSLSVFCCSCPLFGAILCLCMSYFFHYDEIVGRNSTWCEDFQHDVASISITIGVYVPERFVWALLIVFHLPGRLIAGSFYGDYYLSSTSPAAQTAWFKQLALQMKWEQIVETYALVVLSIVDIRTCFPVHAGVFVLWLVAQSAYQWNNTVLHYFSGVYQLSIKSKVIFWVKLTFLCLSWCLAITSGATYLYYMNECKKWAYYMFIVAEYLLVLINITFHFVGVFEFNGARWGFYGDYSTMKDHPQKMNQTKDSEKVYPESRNLGSPQPSNYLKPCRF